VLIGWVVVGVVVVGVVVIELLTHPMSKPLNQFFF